MEKAEKHGCFEEAWRQKAIEYSCGKHVNQRKQL